jgi:hypothetical protein
MKEINSNQATTEDVTDKVFNGVLYGIMAYFFGCLALLFICELILSPLVKLFI